MEQLWHEFTFSTNADFEHPGAEAISSWHAETLISGVVFGTHEDITGRCKSVRLDAFHLHVFHIGQVDRPGVSKEAKKKTVLTSKYLETGGHLVKGRSPFLIFAYGVTTSWHFGSGKETFWALPGLHALSANKCMTTEAARAYLHRSAAKMYSNSFLVIKGWKTAPSVPLIMLLWLDDHQLILLLRRADFRISAVSNSTTLFLIFDIKTPKTKKNEGSKWKISHQTM